MVLRRKRQRLRAHGPIFPLILGVCVAVTVPILPARAQTPNPADIRIGLITRQPPPPPLYEFDPAPEDDGLAGGRLAIRDNNTTGQFTGHRYSLEEETLEEGQDPVAAARALAARGIGYLALHLPADDLLSISDALKGDRTVLFNVSATDDRLRGADCRANVFHVVPSRAMLTDALTQFLAYKRWRRVFLIVGPQPGDTLYAELVRRSARKFGLVIAAEKPWEYGPLARAKADSPTTAGALTLTQGLDYDVAVVADEAGDFGDYLAYRTWDPDPSWAPRAHRRHLASNIRGVGGGTGPDPLPAHVRPPDASARLPGRMAVRAIGEAVTQTKATDSGTLSQFMRGADFSLPAYKGVSLSFRPWDQQLRQPVLLVQPRFLVSVAPEQGFLHQRTPLDTLGFDQPETACKLQ